MTLSHQHLPKLLRKADKVVISRCIQVRVLLGLLSDVLNDMLDSEKETVYYSIRNGGDGSANLTWFLTEEEARQDQMNQREGWGDICTGYVETYVGSNIHQEALNSWEEAQMIAEAQQKAKAAGVKDWKEDYYEFMAD